MVLTLSAHQSSQEALYRCVVLGDPIEQVRQRDIALLKLLLDEEGASLCCPGDSPANACCLGFKVL